MLLQIEKWGHKIIQAGIQFGYPFYLIVTLFGISVGYKTKIVIPLGLVMIAVISFFFLAGNLKRWINGMRAGTGKTIALWVWGMVPYAIIFAVGLFVWDAVNDMYVDAIAFMRKMAHVCIWLFVCYNLSKLWEIFLVTPVEVRIRRRALKKDMDALEIDGRD